MGKDNKPHFKMTPQRAAILKYLENNKAHPSAWDIYHAVAKTFPTMSLATVYNTLKVLRDSGSLRELSIDADKSRFDPDTADHHHMICVRCRKIIDIQKSFRLEVPDEERQDFEILGSHVDFYGLCPVCARKKKESKA